MDEDHMMRNLFIVINKCPCSIVINHIFSCLIVYKDKALNPILFTLYIVTYEFCMHI